MGNVLDNIVWETLTGPHQRYATGSGGVRRYAKGFSPIAGFADPQHPDLALLASYCDPGESFYSDGWASPVPEGWNLEAESTMFKMVWEGQLPDGEGAIDAVKLLPANADAALELAILTHPGPFGLRTLELGDYFGYFEGSQLIAMAGERMQAGSFREISGVCTHPEFQGSGLARKLLAKLIGNQLNRGETPFLHVMSDNVLARGLYGRIGFSDYLESVVRVFSRQG